ncbi:MAG: hypothetical protein HON47_04425 [Candidatus Diapherotrites archaeon]|jgi:proteasome lid subunit RPN8/RPN11|uniref:JAB domain-containing protein n=1 Tax=Candidatus Iainarchaeum sp. TaxID=3101447 RepID=A0A8T5GFN4_9ARCH|nr:hypothetical protein [Candidatus Diapherotrites archaeon]MBT7240887.1 hypothetical protein [Candidatus Diapherotrites archaeon]
MWKLKQTLLEDLFEASNKYYPDEFMCFLSGNKKTKTIEEIVFLPNNSGNNFASIWEGVIPLDDTILGSVHSHPTGRASPSSADKHFFLKYELNLIISLSENKIGFFDNTGKQIDVEIL